MAKRLNENQKKEIIESFKFGESLETLSKRFNCTTATITRNLKKDLGEKDFKILANKNKTSIRNEENAKISLDISNPELKLLSSKKDFEKNVILNKSDQESKASSFTEFVEIAPLDFEIDNNARKELSSIPIDQIKERLQNIV